DNPERQQFRGGEEALRSVCDEEGIKDVGVWSRFHSECYRVPARGDGKRLRDWREGASAAVHRMSVGCDFVATFSPWGSYGNADHLLVRRMVLSQTKLPVQWADDVTRVGPWPIGNVSRLCRFAQFIRVARLEEWQIGQLKEEYLSRGAWTWDYPVQTTVGIYEETA